MDKATLIRITTEILFDTALEKQSPQSRLDAACESILMLRPLAAPEAIQAFAQIDGSVTAYIASRADFQYTDDDLTLLFSAVMPYALSLLESANEGGTKFITL